MTEFETATLALQNASVVAQNAGVAARHAATAQAFWLGVGQIAAGVGSTIVHAF